MIEAEIGKTVIGGTDTRVGKKAETKRDVGTEVEVEVGKKTGVRIVRMQHL